jgi:hypothetical protein
MPVSLDFDTSHHYAEARDGIDVPITLSMGVESVELLAKLDTGAAHCIFERKYAEMLGVEVGSGRLQRFRTVVGSFSAYQHDVTIQTLGIEFSAAVFFVPKIQPSAETSLVAPVGLTGSSSQLSTTTGCSF